MEIRTGTNRPFHTTSFYGTMLPMDTFRGKAMALVHECRVLSNNRNPMLNKRIKQYTIQKLRAQITTSCLFDQLVNTILVKMKMSRRTGYLIAKKLEKTMFCFW